VPDSDGRADCYLTPDRRGLILNKTASVGPVDDWHFPKEVLVQAGHRLIWSSVASVSGRARRKVVVGVGERAVKPEADLYLARDLAVVGTWQW